MKTRVITAIVGIVVLIGVMFTFNTLIFNLVIAAITLIAVHEIYSALGFEKKDWLMYAVLVPYTLLVMTSNYQVMRRLVMPMSFLLVVLAKGTACKVGTGIAAPGKAEDEQDKEHRIVAWAAWRRCWAFMAICLPAWSSASAASRITAPSSRGTAAFWTALTV